jgi:hypothetical protein
LNEERILALVKGIEENLLYGENLLSSDSGVHEPIE